MALYEFRCQNPVCPHHVRPFERLLPISRMGADVRCPACGELAIRLVVPSSLASCVLTKPLNTGGHTKEKLLP